jgi:hypothetical protein
MSNSYFKLDGVWCIRSDRGDLANQTVTVTKRNGTSSQVALGAIVGNAFGSYCYAIAPKAERQAETIGDLSGIVAMFDRAKANKKFPAIVLNGFRVSLAGDRAREPGSLTITTTEKVDNGKRKWLGRVTKAGIYEPGRDADPEIGNKLRQFAADPAGFAGEYGLAHKNCCFCAKDITTTESLAVGRNVRNALAYRESKQKSKGRCRARRF